MNNVNLTKQSIDFNGIKNTISIAMRDNNLVFSSGSNVYLEIKEDGTVNFGNGISIDSGGIQYHNVVSSSFSKHKLPSKMYVDELIESRLTDVFEKTYAFILHCIRNEQLIKAPNGEVLYGTGDSFESSKKLFVQNNKVHVSGSLILSGYLNINSEVPSNSNDLRGNVGDITSDNNFIYVKTDTGWKRSKLMNF